jgi:single-stranded DNA-binding protein
VTTYALVTGTLFRSPEQRASKNGNPFATATIRAKDGDASQFWRITAFTESVQSELMRLGEGDAVSVQGPLKAEIYEVSSGEKRISLGVIADHVLALRQPPTPRERTSPSERPAGPNRDLNDAIPY